MRHSSLAVATLPVGVIQAAFRALLVAPARRAERIPARSLAAAVGAIAVASVATRAERELAPAPTANDVTQRIHPRTTGGKLDADPES
jgi:hypothetical protein